MFIHTNVNINIKQSRFKAHVKKVRNKHILEGITMSLSPQDAVQLSNTLIQEAAPIIAWINHPLYAWAKKKTGKIEK